MLKKVSIIVTLAIIFLSFTSFIKVQAQENNKKQEREILFTNPKTNKSTKKTTNSPKNNNNTIPNKETFSELESLREVFTNNNSSMKVSLRTKNGKSFFREEEDIVYEITSSSSGYLYLIAFSPENRATCLFPNELDEDNYVNEGIITVPGKNTYDLPVKPPFGKESVVALISKEKLSMGEKFEYTWSETAERLNVNLIGAKTRAMGFKKKNSPVSNSDWQGSVILVTTAKKNK